MFNWVRGPYQRHSVFNNWVRGEQQQPTASKHGWELKGSMRTQSTDENSRTDGNSKH